ncbi:hypothetical protein GCM10011609_76310 [Lentzea pudingi]|uniref:Uncharacterized protein n=1 Tax=Lentzea pudingi TaxID=1789439 RepID=A0ABQ2INR8_9PSEU|nr:hypothetical protein GCM10011609_76310 [Lentzea pudingi]
MRNRLAMDVTEAGSMFDRPIVQTNLMTTVNGAQRGTSRRRLSSSDGPDDKAWYGGVTGSAPNTVLLESAAGVGEGVRTGLASVVIGGLMMTQIRRIPWQEMDYTIPVFLTIAIIPLIERLPNARSQLT